MLEIILALAIFSLIAATITSLAVGNIGALSQGGEHTEAQALAQEGIEAVRSIRDNAWNTNIYTTSSVSRNNNQWVFDGEGTTETIGKYTRTIYFSDVCRNGSDEIVDCPGSYTDVQSKLATVEVSWSPRSGVTNTVELFTYLTNWDSNKWIQTDWSGGIGQAIWSNNDQYDAGANVDHSTSGQLVLAEAATGTWKNAGGTLVTHTDDVDFDAGTFVSTTRAGTGDNANVVLDQSTQWAAHTNSGDSSENFFDIAVVSSDDAWAVAHDGEIFQYDGTNWTEFVDFGNSRDFNAVDAVSASDVWAVTENGYIYNYNGTSWSEDTDVDNYDWNDIDMISASQGWAVADNGEVAEYNGTSWSNETVPSSKNIYAVEAVSATDVWAVGHTGRIWNYSDDLAWGEHTNSGDSSENFFDIAVVSSDDAWAVAHDGEIFQYDGTNWTEFVDFGNSRDFNAVDAVSASDVWAVTENGYIYNYNGTSWSEDTDVDNYDWNDIDMISASQGWAVADNGEVAEYNGTSWSNETVPSSKNIYAVEAVSATDVWAVGHTGRIWNYNGSSWSLSVDTGGTNWYDLGIVSASDIWAVGRGGDIAHYNGTSWDDSISTPTSETLNGIHVISANDIWATGENGVVLHYNGTSWSIHTDTGTEDWNEIGMIDTTSGFVVGDSGEIFEYGTNPSWSLFVDTGATHWYDLGVVSASDIWAVGRGGDIAHYNGTSWDDSISTPTSETLNGIHVISANDIWATGENGVVLHYNGTSWSIHTDTGTEDWNEIGMIDTTSGFVVGDSGEIFEYGVAYEASGTFVSSVIDGGSGSNDWESVFWTETLPSGGEITVSTRSGDTASPDVSWSNWSSELTDETGEDISSSDSRYIQYRLTFTRPTDPNQTPQLDDITIIYNAPTGENLRGVDPVSASDIWAVGNDGVIIHYNGSTWTSVASPTGEDLYGIDMISASDGWAIGRSGVILRYNGSSWSVHTDTSNEAWNTISMVSASKGFAGGNSSNNMAEYDGSAWTEFVGPVSDDINDIYMFDGGTGWAVGDSGKILYYDGSSWSSDSDQGGEDIMGVHMVSTSDGWAVGESGKIWRYNGSSWSEHSDVGDDWEAVVLADASTGWSLGTTNEARRWDGSSWSSEGIPTNQTIYDVEAVTTIDAWAVGRSGTILHFDQSSLYELSGSATSSAFDTGDASPVQVIEWDETLPAGSDIKFQIRSAPDDSGSPGTWTDWYGSSGSGSFFTAPTNNLISSDLNWNQWLQYRVEFSSDGDDTPILTEVKVDYK